MRTKWAVGLLRSGLLLGVLGLVALLSAPEASACAVCFGGEENDWTNGFVMGTVVMLALPPLIIVGAATTIYRAIKRQEAVEEQAESDPLGPSTRA